MQSNPKKNNEKIICGPPVSGITRGQWETRMPAATNQLRNHSKITKVRKTKGYEP